MQSPVFLDASKPLIAQFLHQRWSKDFYLEQVHKVHVPSGSVRLFETSHYEACTKNVWWVVPLVWLPFSLLVYALAADASFFTVVPKSLVWVIGVTLWSPLEWIVHAQLLHATRLLPNCQVAFLLHFLFHGVHHFAPQDKYRLVMPVPMYCILSFVVYWSLFWPLDANVRFVLLSGATTSYVGYDCLHYALHHAGTRLPAFFVARAKYHKAHHFTNANTRFGVTSAFWDRVFHTSK